MEKQMQSQRELLPSLKEMPPEQLLTLLKLAKSHTDVEDARFQSLLRVVNNALQPSLPSGAQATEGKIKEEESEQRASEDALEDHIEGKDVPGAKRITNKQITQLRGQRVALQHLLRNAPVPPHLFPSFHCQETYRLLQAEEASVRRGGRAALEASNGETRKSPPTPSAASEELQIKLGIDEQLISKRAEEMRKACNIKISGFRHDNK